MIADYEIKKFFIECTAYIDPYLPNIVFPLLFFHILIGFNPVRVTDEKKFSSIALIYIRRSFMSAWGVLLLLIVVFPAILSYLMFDSDKYFFFVVNESYKSLTDSLNWLWLLVSISAPFYLRILKLRIIDPYISKFKRKLRIKQTGAKESDIRVEHGKLKSKDFDPTNYIKDGYMFFGLDLNNKPIYMEIEEWKAINFKMIGPSQFGKGVVKGVMIYQSIIKGFNTFFIDLKPDDFIYDIMVQACEVAGREPPIILDFNGIGPGKYAPFVAGDILQRYSRIEFACGLKDTGTDGDHYKGQERAELQKLLPYWDGRLDTLIPLIKASQEDDLSSNPENPLPYINDEKLSKLLNTINFFKLLNSLYPKKDRGINIEDCIKNNRVVYIRSDLDNSLVQKATTLFLMDFIQTANRVARNKPAHTFMGVDEVKFLVSETLARGLATVLSKDTNLSVAYQTLSDLLAIADKTTPPHVIKQGLEINTQGTIIYKAADKETKEWASDQTGSIQKSVSKHEKVKTNDLGGEVWNEETMISNVKENLITENQMIAMPKRVSALMLPGQLGQILHTCWIHLKKPPTGMPTKEELRAKKASNKTSSPVEPPKNNSNLTLEKEPTPILEQEKASQKAPQSPLEPSVEVSQSFDDAILDAQEHSSNEEIGSALDEVLAFEDWMKEESQN